MPTKDTKARMAIQLKYRNCLWGGVLGFILQYKIKLATIMIGNPRSSKLIEENILAVKSARFDISPKLSSGMLVKYVRQYIMSATKSISTMQIHATCIQAFRVKRKGSVNINPAKILLTHSSQSLSARNVVNEHRSMTYHNSDMIDIAVIMPNRDFHKSEPNKNRASCLIFQLLAL